MRRKSQDNRGGAFLPPVNHILLVAQTVGTPPVQPSHTSL